VPQQESFEPKLRGLEIADGIFTRTAQVTNRFILHRGNIDRGEVPRAHQACQFDSIAAVGFDPIPSLFRNQGGGHDPTVVPLFAQITIKPVAAWAGFVDKDEVFGLRLELAGEVIDVDLSCADGPKGDDLGAMILSDIGDRDGVFVDIHTDVKRARLVHG
jgi:hypothetical protein